MIRMISLGAALVLAPAAAIAQAPKTPAAYVMKAGAGDQYEIQSSKLVMATTANAKLKSFATMMVADHSKSTADVKAAAISDGLRPASPKLDAKGVADVAALRVAKGTARDRLYITQQKAAHAKALALHQGYAGSGTAPALKTVAGNIAPVVEHHIAELGTM